MSHLERCVGPMNRASAPRWLHWSAWLCAAVALLPIALGAVVTTVGAGMAFADWPTSDGYSMVGYPWLRSSGDQFLEHGHRLAGMLTGLVVLSLSIAVCSVRSIRWSTRCLVLAILAGVITQGILGGLRVRRDDSWLAFVHGQFAPWVFSLIGALICTTSNWWQRIVRTEPASATDDQPSNLSGWSRAAVLCGATFVLLVVQYLLGGQLRHLGSANAWLIHPWLAFGVLMLAGLAWWESRTRSKSLAWLSASLLVALVCQVAIGVGTWATKYGFPQWGILAVQQTDLQTALRSLHKVVGLVAFALVFNATLVAVTGWFARVKAIRSPISVDVTSSATSLEEPLVLTVGGAR